MDKTIVNPPNLFDPSFHAYSHAVRVGKTIFVAGQMAFESYGNGQRRMVGVGDIAAQANQVFKNIELILKQAGATLGNVVTMTVFLKNILDLDRLCQVRREAFKRDFPASTAVQVSDFANPDALVEINVTTVLE